jgi:Calx-beta domain
MKRITGSTRRGARLLVPLSLLALIPFLDAANAAAPRLPSLSISPPASIAELDQGTTSATFAVKLSAPSRSVVRVRFMTVGSFATQGTDYRAAAGRLVFKPGQRTKQIDVQIIGDTVPEDVEDFYIRLWKPTNARIRVDQAGGKIAANDLPAPFRASADLKAAEGPATGHADITLDAATGKVGFTLEVRNSARAPVFAHIHSRTMALGGAYPTLTPVPPRDGVVTGAIDVSRRTILLMNANLADFFLEVHVDTQENVPADLSGDLRRVP